MVKMAEISGKLFIGRWKGDGSNYTNFEEFAKATGIPANIIDNLRNAVIEMELKCENGQWTYDFKSTAAPSKNYTFIPGVEKETTDPFGKGVKLTITFDSETQMTEIQKSELMGWKEMKMTRVIQDGGNKLLETAYLEDGTSMTYLMTKC